ncbi:DUF3108 domain-containing protein [Bdellovibrio sp. HCB337]|uniref:DUF3108 domain-containing protein n=1 Tax=Bdellovibrio sp. HCB337 TaxID=3394358 RepID=UPI0039A663B5
MKRFYYFVACILLIACASSTLKYEKAKELETNTEFDKAVRIEGAEVSTSGADVAATPVEKNVTTPAPKATPSELEKNLIPEKKSDVKTAVVKPPEKKVVAKKAKKEKKAEEPAAPQRRQPEIEDDAGFQGRRPLKDPFSVGEVVTHEVSYFATTAGTLKLKVEPMVAVNGRKAYNFVTEIKTSPMYSRLYSVDDRVETFVDFETLVPRVFALHVKESSQLREARMLFDEKTNRATFWEKKVTEKSGAEEKKQAWDILPYSQNVFSAVFYMRNFQWEPGKEIAFRVADDEQNLIFSGKCLRREKIKTEIGEKNALVIQPKIILKGKFKPVGDILIWLSDDEYKYPLKIESEIKIGTLVSEVISITPGQK